jgi:hypothetical protein
MPSFLGRCQQGECEQVWAELVALGDQVRAEPLYSDALAVARETMRRARMNIEMLIPRLRTLGYAFGYGWLDADERTFAVGQPPVFSPPGPDAPRQIAELERLVGPLPVSLHAFYAMVGSLNFVGAAPQDWHIDAQADPLYVYPIEEALAEYDEWTAARRDWETGDDYDPGRFQLPIAPDYLHKYNISGGMWYHILLLNPAIDVHLEAERHATTFVSYLRICFRWGGFPGLERVACPPTDDLAFLTRDLLPI